MGGFYWLASYPKSGNTWLRLALASLERGGASIDFTLDDPWVAGAFGRGMFDSVLEIGSSDLTHEECETLRPRVYELLAGQSETPMIRKVHDAWTLTPRGEPLFPPAVTLGAIYVVRDPRDVAISLGAFLGKTIDQVIDRMADPGASLAETRESLRPNLRQRLLTWSGHVESWMGATGVRVLTIRYEDMLADPVAVLGRVADFVGWTVSPSTLAAAVRSTSFDTLQAEEDRHGFREKPATADRFFRRGVAGEWADTLTLEQVARLERGHGRSMTRLGYALASSPSGAPLLG